MRILFFFATGTYGPPGPIFDLGDAGILTLIINEPYLVMTVLFNLK